MTHSQIFTPQPWTVCGIAFTHGVWMGGKAAGKSLYGLYLRKYKVYGVNT